MGSDAVHAEREEERTGGRERSRATMGRKEMG
jgi:hypothetical protein